ncbi:aminopeptidase [Kaistella faecalis]|uniref:aminopeptidase n=1 Tax=Kaistella faecalis TaxID=2852098 RepID=UPI001C46FE87|nr:aminopeptidase [Chryseobacterium faecale]UFK98338.1 aminopeptidase [Chryseobacterium faecale]
MNRILWGFLLILNYVAVSAQQDSIYIDAEIRSNNRQISVTQEIIYTNNSAIRQDTIKLLNWTAAYKNRNTPLAKRKLEDRKNDLHFAKAKDLGNIENLKIKIGNLDAVEPHAFSENIFLPLSKSLKSGEKIKISLQYLINLPSPKFTGYGSDGKKWMLKYFFIVPDGFEEPSKKERFYLDIEENQSPGLYWKVNLNIPPNYSSQSNLKEIQPNYFEGILKNDPEFLISENHFPKITAQVDGETTAIDFGYNLSETEKQILEFYLPLHLNFIKSKTGFLPQKIFVTEKFRDNENFSGISDLKFWKFKYQLFSDAEKSDLNYFSILSKKSVEQATIFEKSKDHWLTNGLKTYLEIEYVNRYYKEKKLLGDLPENINIFGFKPLKLFYASDLKLAERYGLTYQYIMNQNLDQRIAEPYEKLSNFNANAISHFETGSLFSFIAEKMGKEKFDDFLTDYLHKNSGNQIDQKDFLDHLSLESGYSSDFFDPFIQKKNRVNFKLKRYAKTDDEFQVKISKNTDLNIPFKIETETETGEIKEFWFDTDDSKDAKIYNIPQSNAEKIVVNSNYIFPENNFRDNYRYTKGLFANTKKIKLKLFKDIPNPEFNEIYLNPRLNFNAYDKVLVGLNFRNTSFFERKFNYSFTPYFSSGTGKLTGSGGLAYSFQPADSFYRSLDVGVSGSYFHYDYDLTYRKFSAFASFNFTKNPRSDVGRSLALSYNFFDKDVNPKMSQTEYAKYNLWNLGYGYADRRIIHEKSFSTNLQWMEDFQKISAEAFYRWEYAQDKKVSFRFFGGYFITNKTKNDLFDYGISRVSNYAFSYGLLGQSATTGLLSQQLILAEGGFKSYVGKSANQWITSVNVDSHVWRWFNIYADAGVYKNRSLDPKFIWDSGVKVKVIPDFLEVYFPIQSSLGFEPSFKDYGSRIRFTLVLNFNAVTNYFRRGWF